MMAETVTTHRTQKIPKGYEMLRLRGRDVFSYRREGEKRVPDIWLTKADTLNAMWQDFRARQTTFNAIPLVIHTI